MNTNHVNLSAFGHRLPTDREPSRLAACCGHLAGKVRMILQTSANVVERRTFLPAGSRQHVISDRETSRLASVGHGQTHWELPTSPVQATRCDRGPVAVRAWRQRAFSLIEIMVAVSLLAVIIVGLLAMFYQVQRAFRAGTAQADILEGGRATMNLIVRDLQEMTAGNHEFLYNCVVTNSFGAVNRFQNLSTGSQRTNFLQDVAFLSRFNDEWIGTSYRVSNAVSGVGVLYRFVTRGLRETLPINDFTVISNVSDSVSFRMGLGDPGYARVMDGVVSLTITPSDTNGLAYYDNDPTRARIPAATDSRGFTNANIYIKIPHAFAFRSNALPAYLDIELAILEPSTLAKFNARWQLDVDNSLNHPWKSTNYLAQRIGQTHVFRQRVAIRPSATQVSALY